MKLLISLFTFVLIKSECNLHKLSDDTLTTVKVIQKYGYPVEVHTVETTDGYLLQMHRIPHGIKNNTQYGAERRKKFPVFYSHGLFGSSADLVLQGPNRSLAFLLADLGFDVWLGNFRGNTYSRANLYLSPNTKKFWDFSFHESGIYDLPAQIDYVCNETKAEKVIHLGYSMGTTTFFIMVSTLPQYNNKIEVSLLMAPVAYVKNLKSPFIKWLLPFGRVTKFFDDLIAHGEFLPHSKLIRIFSKFFCEVNKVEERLCESIVFLLTGSDPKEFDKNLLSFYLKFYPSGYSIKGPYHYSQLIESGAFRQYDHGLIGNIINYGKLTPPNYNVSAITVEMNFYVGSNDYLSTLPDVKRLAKQLPTLKKMRLVNDSNFNHIDFMIAPEAKVLLYDIMIKDLQSHLNELNDTD